nr:glycine cleavage system h protein 2, mitochondrial [Quercus suber]
MSKAHEASEAQDITSADVDLVVESPAPPLLGCLAGTSAKAESLISGGLCADEPSSTLGKAEIEGDRALIGLELSNCFLSPPRVGIEEWGVSDGDEGDRVEGTSDIQGIDTFYQANQSVLALTEVETAYAVEALVVKDLEYLDSREWVKVEGNSATVGIIDHSQDHLGDVVYVELLEVGDPVSHGSSFGAVEVLRLLVILILPFQGNWLK